VKALYTIPELAAMADVSYYRMKCLLEAYGVELVSSGKRNRLVPLSQIREKIKPLYDSFQMRERYQQVVATLGQS
jgi:hypothetical protein